MMQLWRPCLWLLAGRGQAQALLPRVTCWGCTHRHFRTSNHSLSKTKSVSVVGKPQHQPSSHLQQLVLADAQYVEKQKEEILKIFPNVKSIVKNMYGNLSSNLDKNYRCEEKTTATGRINHQLVFCCSFTITWPTQVTFSGYGFSKKNAELSAIVKATEMLYKGNYMTEDGYPVTASLEERQQCMREWNLAPRITIPAATLQEGLGLLRQYEQEMELLMETVQADASLPPLGVGLEAGDEEGPAEIVDGEGQPQTLLDKQEQDTPHNLLTNQKFGQHQTDSEYRSRLLYYLLQKRRLRQRAAEEKGDRELPMLQYRDKVLSTLRDKRVLVVSGDTGCGKSTQVPQMILDQWVEEGRGSECNILVTQPRRISAVSLAKWVAKERGEALGESIGYHVRLDHRPLQGSGGIMFCTTGMLLQGIHLNPGLAGVSHVIVDEVHERSVQTDMLLIILRRLLQQHPSLRLVLMSASLSTQQLLRYFEEDKAALIEVPGTLFPLTRHYLPKALQVLGINPKRHKLAALTEPNSQPSVNVDLVVDVIRSIDQSRPAGAVLCFLPGWQDISLVQSRLQRDDRLGKRLRVVVLHSRLPTEDQEMIFEPPPPGQRKVVLSTNLAETSLTVTDVVYVVDTGFHKEYRYNSKKGMSVLGNHWISRANSQQRAGRAGRVQPGEVFHLYSPEVHCGMAQFPVPEIVRIPLEHVILQCKGHCSDESVRSFLEEGLSVPSHRLVSSAIATLEQLGMLTSDPWHRTEHLTALGRRVTHFSTPPHYSKAIVWASIFRCVDPVISISAVLTGGRGIFHHSIDRRARTREVKVEADPTSDLLATYELQKEWHIHESYEDKIYFCNSKNLSHRYLRFNEGVKRVYGNHLYDACLLNHEDIRSAFSSWNVNRDNGQLVLGMLLAGMGRLLHYQRGSYHKGILNPHSLTIKSEEGERIDTSSECVLHQPPKDTTALPPHLLCLQLSRDGVSRRTVARDLSLLQPLTVALFSGGSLEATESPEGLSCVCVDGKGEQTFQVDKRTSQFLLRLRAAMDQAAGYLVETRGLHATPANADRFCDKLVMYVSKLLKTQERGEKRLKKETDEEDEWLSLRKKGEKPIEKW